MTEQDYDLIQALTRAFRNAIRKVDAGTDPAQILGKLVGETATALADTGKLTFSGGLRFIADATDTQRVD